MQQIAHLLDRLCRSSLDDHSNIASSNGVALNTLPEVCSIEPPHKWSALLVANGDGYLHSECEIRCYSRTHLVLDTLAARQRPFFFNASKS